MAMFALRRWWNRHALQTGLMVLAVGTAWAVRQQQGGMLYEAYRWITQPLQPGIPTEQVLEDRYLLELQQRIVELENQNRSLRNLLEYNNSLQSPGVPAAVIGRSADYWWQQITLNRGQRDGIKVGYIVTGPGGLVGRVSQVSPHTSQVLLISDPTSRVGATISRSRVMGYIRGKSGERAVMEFFDKSLDVKVGDVVSTSAYSHRFPADIPIGRIESLNLNKSPAPEAVIQLSAPLNQLEWVTVHRFSPAEDEFDPMVDPLLEAPDQP